MDPPRAGISDVDHTVRGGYVVEKLRTFGRVTARDLTCLRVDGDELIDVGDVQRSAIERQSLGRVHTCCPLLFKDIAFRRDRADVAVAVLRARVAPDVRYVDEASIGIVQSRFRPVEPFVQGPDLA